MSCSLLLLLLLYFGGVGGCKPSDLASEEVPNSVELEDMYTTYRTAWWKTEVMFVVP